MAACDPAATLIAVASKTFTTTETMTNAASALEWLRDGGVDDPYGRVVALTAAPEKAVEWGVDETRVLPFSETVGGRYSLWSSIGFPVALALGTQAFGEFLEGAAAIDGISSKRRWTRTWSSARPSPISITRRRAGARPAPCLPMTNACACCPIISSSWRWNRTASG
jgi:glucose-6-phosphate isomerase